MGANTHPVPLFDAVGNAVRTRIERAQSIEGRAVAEQGYISAVIGVSGDTKSEGDVLTQAVTTLLAGLRIETVAHLVGESYDDTWGPQYGAWIAVQVSREQLDSLRTTLAILAEHYEQDAIALTYGVTQLIQPVS